MTDAANAEDQARATAAIQQALRSPLPRIYANSFINVLSDADVMTVFQSNGQNVSVLNMSYVVAKALGSALMEATTNYETKYNTKIPSSELASAVPPRDFDR